MTDGPKITLDRETFKVLASDTRLDILKSLDARQKTVTELAREMNLNKATVFEHLEKLQEAQLVQKLEDERKWVYYQLSWKARRLLHPEAITIALLLSSSLAAVLTAVVSFFLYWKSRATVLVTNDDGVPPGDTRGADSPSASALNAPAQENADLAAGVPPPIEQFVHDPVLLWTAIAFVAMAGLLVAFALAVRHRARSAAAA